ncbi:MAG: PAS domain S-box protein [Desulfobacterales bacterium]|nr:PAS domain S-box protein [Desulfobacterales bacterium]
MKTQSRILLSVVCSVVVSIVVAFIAFSIQRGMNTEHKRIREIKDIIHETHALSILTASFKVESGRSDVRQVKDILLSLDSRLKGISSQAPREKALIEQLQQSHKELRPLIDQISASGQVVSGIERARLNTLATQIWMKVQFISDDTNELMNFSLTKIKSAGEKAGVTVIVLIIILAITIGAIYFLSSRGIVRVQEELRESEARLIEAQRLARVGDWVWDVTMDEVSWSREMYEIFGINPNLPPPDYHDYPTYYTPESWEQLESSVKRALEKGEPYALELEHIHGDSTHRWHIAKGEAIQDSSGCTIKLRGTAQDITERKRMEEALRKSEGRLRRFFDSGVVGVVYWNLEGSVTDANDRFLDMVGYTREELEGGRVKWSEMTPPEYHKHDEYALHELAATGIDTAYEKEFVRKDGSLIPVIVGAAMLKDNPKDGIAFVLDITARKRAEVELRKAHEKLH